MIINVRECITARHLLERIVASMLDTLDELDTDGPKLDRRPYARTENFAALSVHLSRLLEGREKFVLVLDAMDRLRESSSMGTLIAALGRLGEFVPSLCVVLVTTLPLAPGVLHAASVPRINFPPYTRGQLLAIVGKRPLRIFATPPSKELFPDYTADLAAEDDAWLWGRYISAVYDSLTKHTGRDVVSFQNTAHRLWREFVTPVEMGQFGTRDFSRLMVNRRALFMGEEGVAEKFRAWNPAAAEEKTTTDTAAVSDSQSPPKTTAITATPAPIPTETKPTPKPRTAMHDLPTYTTHLLIAAYLASYNPSRTDVTYFMKHSDKRRNKRHAPSVSARSKHRKIPRHLLTPSPFPLDRLLAIFRALLPGPVGQVADIGAQVATLGSLRLLVRVGGGVSGAAGDVLEAGARWRVNIGWEAVRGMGRSVGIEVGELLVGGVD
jgi:origin recognition complex subunit 5